MQFTRWYDDALGHGQLQPDAMIVASSTPDGRPSVRMVLLRGVDDRGFCFYTNFESRKGRELDANPHAAIVFHWPEVLRQVRATGAVERVSDVEADAYWFARSTCESRERVGIGAERRRRRPAPSSRRASSDVEARFADGDVPRPPGWGGYRVVPDDLEFWQHRDDRLHDRLRYSRATTAPGASTAFSPDGRGATAL